MRALNGIDVEFASGEFTCIMGPSGSGKSTLMHCMAGLDSLSGGQTFIGDTDVSSLGEAELTNLRRDRMGFIFQAFNLVPTLSAEDRPGTGISTFDELPERLRRSLTAAATTLGVQVAGLYEAITTYGRSNGAAIAAALGVNESDLIAALQSPNRG